jgi:hypothetical protein
MSPSKKLNFLSLDMMEVTIEDSMPENSNLLSLPMMLSLAPKLLEDHQTIPQDQSEEMIASFQELLLNSKALENSH